MLNQESLQEAVHAGLRAQHAPGASVPPALAGLLLVKEREQALARQGNALAAFLAVDRVLSEALDLLQQQDETAARILRWRFVDDETLIRVAHRLNVSEHTVSRLQRAAIEQLAAILATQEQALRDDRIQRLEAALPPPTYTELFGVGARRQELAHMLGDAAGPGVVAIVGIGGIGKTALADAVARDALHSLFFEQLVWLRFEARTMSGQPLTPQLGFESLMDGLAARLGLEPGAAAAGGRLAAVRNRLKATPHLVVVDNLESEAVADYLLDNLVGLAGPGKFLLTMRSRPAGQAAVRHVDVPELSLPDAAQLLRRHAQDVGVTAAAQATEQDVAQIYDLTGGNPLALKLVVGLLDYLSLQQVLEQLTHSRRGPVEDLYRHIYWQAWRTLDQPARALLQVMPLVAESGGDPQYLQAISGLDEGSFWLAVQQLRARSLLEVRGRLHEKRYGVHRLTETFVRTEIIHWPEEEG